MKTYKIIALRAARAVGGTSIIKLTNVILRKLASQGHRIQMTLEWGIAPHPEWFDHFIDQYYWWHKSGIPHMWERGIFNLMSIKPAAEILELCCGDGFNAYHFYRCQAKSIMA